jgi:hypothetical protein
MLPDDSSKDIDEFTEENRKVRKVIKDQKLNDYEKYKTDLERKVLNIESHDIKETMKNERRDWINQQKLLSDKNEPPQQLKKFYQRNDVAKIEVEDDQQKKAKEQIAKDKLKKEQDKKKKDEQGQFTRGRLISP